MMRRFNVSLAVFALAVPASLLPPTAVNSAPEPELPELTAEAWTLYDADAGDPSCSSSSWSRR